MSSLVVSIHDVAPRTTDATARWLEALDARDIPCTLLVVPGPWSTPTVADGAAFCKWVAAAVAHGHEVALHGWTHQADTPGGLLRQATGSLIARGAGEFWSLDHGTAAERIALGRAVLHEIGLKPVGFTPPGWLASAATLDALRSSGLRYTTSHRFVTDLHTGERHSIPALCHRPGGVMERVGSLLLERWSRSRARRGLDVRIGLHPDDLRRPGLYDSALRAIDGALASGARAVTYADLVTSGAAVVPA